MKAVLTCSALILMMFLQSCTRERATSVAVRNGPSFNMGGSGRLASFTVYGPQNGQSVAFPHADVSVTVWRIEASRGFFEGAQVRGLHIVYGKVPDGYRQVVPESTQPPPRLSPGIAYSFFAESTNAPVADGYFYMNGSQPIQTTIPDLCVMLSSGHEVRVNCDTKRPYEEPVNLLEVVRKNEITASPESDK